MAENLETKGGEGVVFNEEIGVQSEKVVATEAVVVEEGADVAISEKHDAVDNEKASQKIIEGVNDRKTSRSSVAEDACSSKHGKSRTSDKPGPNLEHARAQLAKSWTLPPTKKLLILDVNGLLVARHANLDRTLIPRGTRHAVIARTYMTERPFCASFLAFCFENFHVGVWSSMMEHNLRKALEFICKGMEHKFLFLMHQGDCTNTGMWNPSKKKSPLFLKELGRVWARFREFDARNTLLIDDTPYKTLWNPPHTAIFPEAYLYDERDEFLKGSLVEYLRGVRDAPDVQEFVRAHPFGEPAVAPGCLHWDVYQQVLKRKKDKKVASSDVLPRLEQLSLV